MGETTEEQTSACSHFRRRRLSRINSAKLQKEKEEKKKERKKNGHLLLQEEKGEVENKLLSTKVKGTQESRKQTRLREDRRFNKSHL